MQGARRLRVRRPAVGNGYLIQWSMSFGDLEEDTYEADNLPLLSPTRVHGEEPGISLPDILK